jgi:glutamyl-tRNA synthetase
MNKVRTRFAPSPTGYLHIGGLRSAVYPYALARHSGGEFILRIEDTDRKRYVEGAAETLVATLKQFGLDWDEFYVQSKRKEEGIYQKAADKLVEKGFAFYCQCPARNAKEKGYSDNLRDPCREKNLKKGAVKLKVPDGEIVKYRDFVLGKEVSWNTSTVPDTTLLKSDGFPTYHLAVVVDDSDMRVSHVLRGHDWMPSTPIHLLVYKYLGYKLPEIGHMTDIMDPAGGKLSKRKGSTTCEALIKDGYLPEAILNFVMLLGWAPKDNRELFTLDQFVQAFDPSGFQKANPVLNYEKLDWFNGEYIRKTQNSELKTQIHKFFRGKYPEEKIEEILPLVKERIKTLKEFETLAGFFFEGKSIDPKLMGKGCKNHLKDALIVVKNLKDWNLESLNNALMQKIKEKEYKTGDFFMDLRVAITGSRYTPPINDSIIILGKNESVKRIEKVLNH